MMKVMDKVDVERILPLVGHSGTRAHNLRIRIAHLKQSLGETTFPKACESAEFAKPICGECWDSE